MAPTIPVWPAVLTDKDWQKKKGPIAKLATKTGIGTKMTAVQKEFAKIKWEKFEASQIPPNQKHEATILKYRQAAEDHYKTAVEPVRTELLKLADLAGKQALAWKKNRLIPSAVTKHAETVSAEAKKLAGEIKSNGPFMLDRIPQFNKLIEQSKQKAKLEIAKLEDAITNLEKALGEAARTPTKSFWADDMHNSAHQRCRSMCNAIRNIPPLHAKYWKTWQPFGDEYHKDAPDGPPAETTAMTKKIHTVQRELATFKANYKRDLAG
jgi:hypothetical protein